MGERKIVGEDRRAPEQEVPNGGIAGWFGALFSRPVIVRVALDGLTEFELCWGWSLGKGSRRAVRALHAKKRRNKLSRGSGRPNGGGEGRVGKTGGPLSGRRGEPWPSG